MKSRATQLKATPVRDNADYGEDIFDLKILSFKFFEEFPYRSIFFELLIPAAFGLFQWEAKYLLVVEGIDHGPKSMPLRAQSR